MLIDTYAPDWIDCLRHEASALEGGHALYLLIDGAFCPGLHETIQRDRKVLLFESLPSCADAAMNVSPFLLELNPADQHQLALLERCDQWPMVSVIETAEPLTALAKRLAAWCIVEADGQAFNFRFPDTRRLPAILKILSVQQRVHLVGTAVRWSYISREGTWCAVIMAPATSTSEDGPVLDPKQFAALVDDSRADELLSLLTYRGHDPYRQASRSHALVSNAIHAVTRTTLNDHEVIDWCEWYWKNDVLLDGEATGAQLLAWRETYSSQG